MALCISRNPGERITIGDDIIVTVREVRGRHVKLSIEAPMELKINRVGPAEEQPQNVDVVV